MTGVVEVLGAMVPASICAVYEKPFLKFSQSPLDGQYMRVQFSGKNRTALRFPQCSASNLCGGKDPTSLKYFPPLLIGQPLLSTNDHHLSLFFFLNFTHASPNHQNNTLVSFK